MSRRNLTKAVLAATAAVTLAACATTSLQSTWKDPAAAPLNLKGKKVVALVVTDEEALRYTAEDEAARRERKVRLAQPVDDRAARGRAGQRQGLAHGGKLARSPEGGDSGPPLLTVDGSWQSYLSARAALRAMTTRPNPA